MTGSGAAERVERRARLVRQGNSVGVTLARELLGVAGLARGDVVLVTAERRGVISLRRADDPYSRAMAAGRAFAGRYRRTLAAFAR